jgi:hypothetical protein
VGILLHTKFIPDAVNLPLIEAKERGAGGGHIRFNMAKGFGSDTGALFGVQTLLAAGRCALPDQPALGRQSDRLCGRGSPCASRFAEALAKHGLTPRMDEVYQKELATLPPKAA